jgi:hypothetical protein
LLEIIGTMDILLENYKKETDVVDKLIVLFFYVVRMKKQKIKMREVEELIISMYDKIMQRRG